MDTIKFENKEFKVRELNLAGFGHVLISTTLLNDLLFHEGNYVSDEAAYIDEQIFYFVEVKQIDLRENELINLLVKEIK